LVSQSKGELSEDVLNTVHSYQDQLIHGVNMIGQSAEVPLTTDQDVAQDNITTVIDEVADELVTVAIKKNADLNDEREEKVPLDDIGEETAQAIDELISLEIADFSAEDSVTLVDNEIEQVVEQISSDIDLSHNKLSEDAALSSISDDEQQENKDIREQALSANDDELPLNETIGALDVSDQMAESQESPQNNSHEELSSDEVNENTTVSAPSDSSNQHQDNIVSFPTSTNTTVSVVQPVAPSKDADTSERTDGGIAYNSSHPPKNIVSNSNAATNAAVARRPAPQETVKVSADLMEELVNLAGETSISRGRMEEQMSDLGSSLEEMEQTVGRLDEQLRRLDIETEAQVVFRQEQLSEQEDFDPLEMDRYSQLQQLSRSLIESASDLKDLKQTLANKTRDAETVLLQQSRINTELQEGLMRSRMVPFSRIVPRLRRIVRQMSSELGKKVIIEFDQTEGELDRNMMERMVAPLEHMLRNAVDHGIESTDIRKQLEKPPAGRITLSLSREGSNVLLLLTDDGAGMSVDRIRAKAIQQELMNSDAQLSDKEILQFIFQAGFSTAESVTQISGRGVGMDVVSSEIKQLGGSIDISSVESQGTQFTIRLPFTVSVNRALMISMGDDRYAIPLNSIEGIARIAPEELEGYYSDPDSRFHYAGTDYQLQYMGTLLNKDVPPRIDGHQLPVPILLVRSADHSVAIQVDSLNGSQEIVVKTLGAQFSSVQGLSGATIMGDGHVVIILDTNAMIRQQYALSVIHQLAESEEKIEQPIINRNPIVMVVDDSVTVRKVTTRFLEREGFDVITAKDGVNAIEVLRDQTPDIMLLDIEMPRMDGFEVARRVRATSQTKNLPIIMITSRTGEKHRQTGIAAGANEYMGKPFQEDVLLENIHQLLHVDR
jgi:chemosensory pili system protein ChpA (sensor histidine kinase/response regulator)